MLFDLVNLCVKEQLNKQTSTSAGCAAPKEESTAALGNMEGCTEVVLTPWLQFDAPCSITPSSVRHQADGTLTFAAFSGGTGRKRCCFLAEKALHQTKRSHLTSYAIGALMNPEVNQGYLSSR